MIVYISILKTKYSKSFSEINIIKSLNWVISNWKWMLSNKGHLGILTIVLLLQAIIYEIDNIICDDKAKKNSQQIN